MADSPTDAALDEGQGGDAVRRQVRRPREHQRPRTGTEDRPGKSDRPDRHGGTLPDDGRARTREVKLAALFTQTTLDDDGRPVRDPGSSSYLATFAPAAEFGPLVAAEARRRGADHIRQLVVLGDGAVWIWNLAGKLLPARHPDRGHLPRPRTPARPGRHPRVHRPRPPAWLADRLAELDAGDIEAIIAAARADTPWSASRPPTGTRP